MAIRTLPVVGRPTEPPAPLRKIAIEEHFIDPALERPHFGDSFSGELAQDGSGYGGFNREFSKSAAWIERAPISENDRRKICYGNAAALFGLPPGKR